MDICNKKSIIFLLFLSLIFVPSVFAADYFPLKVGNKWVYSTNDGLEAVTVAAGIEDVSGVKYFTLETSIGGKITQKEYYCQQANNLISKKSIRGDSNKVEVTYEPAKIWLKYPVYVGRVWLEKIGEKHKSSNFRDLVNISRTVKVEAEETITVPAGTFKCYKVLITQDIKGLKTTTFLWYADGVGIIKQESDVVGSDKSVFELKEYSIK